MKPSTSDRASSPTSVSPAEFVSGIDDLLTEILLRLPLTSVAKFKSVSKHWLSLISTIPQFSLPKPLNALISRAPGRIFNPELVPLDGTKHVTLQGAPVPEKTTFIHMDSCNGLYLCYNSDKPPHYKFYVSNPTTNLRATLPRQYPSRSSFHVMAAYLAFDPSVSSYYNVVCFFRSSGSSDRQVMIYSSEKQNWRLSQASSSIRHQLNNYEHGIFWNGAIYWASSMVGHSTIMDQLRVYRFDMEQENIVQVPLPRGTSTSDQVAYLGQSRGHLHLIMSIYDRNYNVGRLDIYEMKKGSERWCLKYSLGDVARDLSAKFGPIKIKVVPTVSVHSWWSAFPHVVLSRVVFFDAGGARLYFQVGMLVVRYNIRARTVTQIHYGGDINLFTRFHQRMEILYTSGLVSEIKTHDQSSSLLLSSLGVTVQPSREESSSLFPLNFPTVYQKRNC